MSTKGPTSAGPSALDRRGPFTALSIAGRGGPVDHDGPFTGTVPTPVFRFTVQPSSQIVEADGVNTATFSVTVADGVGTVTYQWQVDDGGGFDNIIGATSASYETDILTVAEDGYLYRCQATDDNETITSDSATLQVYAPLAIDTQPDPATKAPDETATFSVVASGGYGTLSYQWQVDDGGGFANISGATSASYETPPIAEIDDGNEYRCVVTDSLSNQVISDSALLTVSASVSPSDIFTGANDDWWDASTDAHMTFVAARTVDQYSVTSEIVTIRTTAAHGMLTGDSVVVAGVAAAVNGTWTVATAPTSTTLTYIAVGAGDIGDTAAAGTVNWEHRKISEWAGVMGNWSLTQATLANMPQYNATTKRVLANSTRSYSMVYSTGLSAAMQGSDLGLWAVSARTASATQNYLFGLWKAGGLNYMRFGGGFSDATQQAYVVGGGSPSTLSYTNAANNNGNTKIWCVNGEAAARAMYVNDMSSSVASDANSGRPTATTGLNFTLFLHSTQYYSGDVGSHGFKVAGTLTEQSRIDLKAWGEAQGDTYA